MPTMTITTTADQATRIAAAYGAKLNADGSPASAEQVRQDVIEHLRNVVRSYETAQAAAAAADAVGSIDPT